MRALVASILGQQTVTPSAPVNTALPVISGNEGAGETLSVTTGTWTGFPAITFTYQWQANTVDISGATSSTYVPGTLQEGDTITCEVTGTNTEGSAMAESAATGAIGTQTTPWDVIVIAGQSNGSGRGLPLDAELDASNDDILQWETQLGSTGGVLLAEEYLTSYDGGDTGISFALNLAKEYEENRLTAGRKVMILSVCDGGTGLVGQVGDGTWNPQTPGVMVTVLKSRIAEVAAAMPATSAFTAMFWSQGERDAQEATATQSLYESLWAELIDDIRDDTAMGNVPVVALGMPPSWATGATNRSAIDAAHAAIPTLLPNCAYVAGDDTGSTDDIHYNAVQQRANGVNLYAGIATAEANDGTTLVNTSPPTISGTEEEGFTLTATGGTWTGLPDPPSTWQWLRDAVDISGATSSAYVLAAADVGTVITVEETVTNDADTTTQVSAATGTIVAATTVDVLADFTWDLAYWVEDPAWTPPADGAAATTLVAAVGGPLTMTQQDGTGPTYRASVTDLGSQPALEFTGSEWMTSSASGTPLTMPYTKVAVVTSSAVDNTRQFMDEANLESGSFVGRSTDTWQIQAGNIATTTTTLAANKGYLVIMVFDGASKTGYVNGAALTWGAAGCGANDTDGMTIGSEEDGTGKWVGDIAFAGVLDGTISADDRASLWTWAQDHYGLT